MILPLRYRLVSNFCRGVHWVTTRGTVTCPKPHDKGVNRAQTKSRPVCTFPPHTPSPVPPTLCCFEVVKTIKKCFQKAFSLWYNNPTLKMYPIDYSHMYEMIIFKVFHGSSVYTRKRLKQLKCSSTRGWLNKLWHIIPMEYHTVLSRNEEALYVLTLKQKQNSKINYSVKKIQSVKPSI